MQGPLLANYSQSFVEQLRNASMPYANSTVGLKRRLQFEDSSRLQSFLVWLKLTAKKRMLWGAAAEHHKRKQLVTTLLIMVPRSLTCVLLLASLLCFGFIFRLFVVQLRTKM